MFVDASGLAITPLGMDTPEWGPNMIHLHPRTMEKIASELFVPERLVEFMESIRPREDGRYILLHAIGAGEYWGCFLPGSLVQRADGRYVPIEDVKKGDRVLSRSGHFREVLAVWKHGRHREGVSISVEGLVDDIKTTPNHEFLGLPFDEIVCDRDRTGRCIPETSGTQNICKRTQSAACVLAPKTHTGRWVAAEALALKDFLLCAIPDHDEPPIFTEDEARAIGLWVADGNFIGNVLEFSVADSEIYLVEDIEKLTKAKTYDGHGACKSVRVNRPDLAPKIKALFGEYSHGKRIPGTFCRQPEEVVLAFLSGYFDGDGSQNLKDSTTYAHTVSKDLALGVQRLLWSVKIPATVCMTPGGFHVNFSLDRGRRLTERCRKFSDHTPKGRPSYRQFFIDGYVCLPIRKLERFQIDGPVYDLEVEEEHAYNVGQVVCHNSNKNGDYFPEWSLKGLQMPDEVKVYVRDRGLPVPQEYGYRTFEFYGWPYRYHNNSDPIHTIGERVCCSAYNDRMHRIELIIFVRKDLAPDLVNRIDAGVQVPWSMGSKLPFDVCLPAGSPVHGPEGVERIEDVQEGDLVFTKEGRVRPVTKTFKRLFSGTLVTLDVKGLPETLTLTGNHPIFIFRKEQIRQPGGRRLDERAKEAEGQFVNSEDVKPGDYVFVPKIRPDDTEFEAIDPVFSRLCGYYLGDGHIITQRRGEKKDGPRDFTGVSISCGTDDEEHLNRVVNTLEDLSESKVHVYSAGEDRAAVAVVCHDKILAARVAAMCGRKKEKRLPPEIFYSATESRLALLGGLMDSDGSIDQKKSSSRITITLLDLMRQTQMLALSVGIPATLSFVKSKGNAYRGADTIVGQAHLGATATQILAPYSIKCGRAEPRARWGATAVEREDGFLFPVKTVIHEEVEQEPVFNLSVEEDETYLIGPAVHNCSVCMNPAKTRQQYCFVSGTLITLANGSVKPIEEIRVGDSVLGAEGLPTTVTHLFQREVDEEIVEIRHSVSQEILRCTKEHPILSSPREAFSCYYHRYGREVRSCFPGAFEECSSCRSPEETPDFVKARDLRIGDSVYSPGVLQETPSDLIETDAYMIGLFMAEGSFAKAGDRFRSAQFSIHEDESHLIEKIAAFGEKFNHTAKVYGRAGSQGISVRVHSHDAAAFLHGHTGEYAHSKFASDQVVFSPPQIVAQYLGGLWDGDGHVQSRSGRQPVSRLNTASRSLAWQTSALLRKVGHPAYLGRARVPGGPTTRTNKFDQWYVTTDFLRSTSLSRSAIRRGIEIGSIREIGRSRYRGPVFNFETENNTYVAGGIAVHNCNHLKNMLNRILPDGTKVFSFNYFPRFFDISEVTVPADRSAYSLKKVAEFMESGQASPIWVPGTDYVSIGPTHEEFRRVIETEMEKIAERPRFTLEEQAHFDEMIEIMSNGGEKEADIDKEVPAQEPGKNLGSEPVSKDLWQFVYDLAKKDREMVQEMPSSMRGALRNQPIDKVLQALTATGIQMTPDESEDIIGDRELPDELDTSCPDPTLLKRISGIVPGRSMFEPRFSVRVIQISRVGDEESDLPKFLVKRANGIYDQYIKWLRSIELEKLAELVAHPPVQLLLSPDVLKDKMFEFEEEKTGCSLEEEFLPFVAGAALED